MINYYLLTKPGIIFGNLVTLAAGFMLGSKGSFHFGLFLATMLGLTLIMASACVCNNYIDRGIDKKMARTKNRPLVQGLISGRNALAFAFVLLILGNICLITFTNWIAVAVAGIGFFVYVVLYSVWKCRTIYGTAIGSMAGAVPPVVGYCAASGQFDLAAALLFLILVLWQMPHFFSIALLHLDDYAKAGVPVLPVIQGVHKTKVRMALYIVLFIPTVMLLTFFGYTGYVFLGVTASVGLAWLALCLLGFRSRHHDRLLGRQMFVFSLIVMAALCLAMMGDRIGPDIIA